MGVVDTVVGVTQVPAELVLPGDQTTGDGPEEAARELEDDIDARDFTEDLLFEGSAGQEDYIDLPGPSLNDVLGPVDLSEPGTSDPDGAGNRDPDDAGGLLQISPERLLQGGILIALIVAVGQLFTINVGDSTS